MAPGLARWRDSAPDARDVVVFTLVFEPIWPSPGTNRAAALAQRYGFRHLLLDESRIAAMLGIRTSLPHFFTDFLDTAGNATTHVFATYLISMVARRWLTENCSGHGYYAMGYNREDLLAEALFMLINGDTPPSFPTRRTGDSTLVLPTWRLPKAVLDSCFLKFSAENYAERLDKTTRSRGLAYYLAHWPDSVYPGFGLSLLDGIRRTFAGRFAELQQDDYGLYRLPSAPESARTEFLRLCEKHLADRFR